MYQSSLVCILIFVVSALLARYVGSYMKKVYEGEGSLLDFFRPFEQFIFKLCRIDVASEMNWKQYLVAMLVINSVWLVYGLIILMVQGSLFLNPANNPSMELSLALNSAISFLTSTNLQHYSGETGATHLSQAGVFMFLQFVSAATSLSIGVAVVRGLTTKTSTNLGNFYADFVRSLTRVLLPLCTVTALLFVCCGVPMNFNEPQQLITLQGDSVTVATGPAAAFLPIKELGSNGGGFFGANDAHPFENPNFFSFIQHSVIVFLLPMAFVFFIGHQLKKKKFARMIFAVMTIGYLLVSVPIVQQEVAGNQTVTRMGLANSGNMEGKESRFGPFFSGFYAGENSVITAGTFTGLHDSFTPFSGVCMLVGMNVGAFFGGLGTGWINMFLFVIVTVFIGSLMIGRTAELFGKKIGMPELQITLAVVVLQSMVPMVMTAIACYTYGHYTGANDRLQWLTNKGPHGFTTMIYEYISSAAGNGSGFESLGDNTAFWNLSTSLPMLSGRYVPIIGSLWIAGSLIQKIHVPPSLGTLKLDNVTFGIFLFAVIIVVSVLSLFPALILGPVTEHFLMP